MPCLHACQTRETPMVGFFQQAGRISSNLLNQQHRQSAFPHTSPFPPPSNTHLHSQLTLLITLTGTSPRRGNWPT